MEYRIIRGIPYLSRLISDSDLNTHQEGEAHGVDTLDSVPFQGLSEIGWEISTGSTGILRSVYFQQVDVPAFSDEDTDMVEIDVKTLGLSQEVRLKV